MIAPRNMITADDIKAVTDFLKCGSPLSGYLAGNQHGGAAVQRLEEIWCNKFNRRHAICCNSATSGLLTACMALYVDRETSIAVPALSMSATAAVPHWLGAKLRWMDCDASGGADFQTNVSSPIAIVTNLFGHPIDQRWTQAGGTFILDNAQGILSRYDDKWPQWSENSADICVTSFNVHKQVNAGEMGIITTDSDDLASDMRDFINHGENNGSRYVGLNLRPTEISAVLALSQLTRIEDTIGNLRLLAQRLTDNMPSVFTPILPRKGTQSAWYCYAFRVPERKRDTIVAQLNADGVSCSAMYRPLYLLPAFGGNEMLIEAERLSRETIVFELCAWRYEDDIAQVERALEKTAKL